MGIRPLQFMKVPILVLAGAALVCVGVPARAQSTATQQNRAAVQANDATRANLGDFHEYLENHPDVARELHMDPTLLNKKDFVNHHADLKMFLQNDRWARDQIRRDPNGFMQQEDQFARDLDARRDPDRDAAEFHQFLDAHPEIAEQVRRNPSLVENRNFADNHPALETYLRENPGVRDEIRQNPDTFVHNGDRSDVDANARFQNPMGRDLAEFDRFMDSHREIAEELRKDPSLVNNKAYLSSHPDLQAFLQSHQGIDARITQNPDAFMRQEDQFNRDADNRDNRFDRDGDRNVAQFHDFLDSHPEIAEQIRRNPSLAEDRQFADNHPALQGFYRDNPAVRDDIRQNPESFMQQEDRLNNRNGQDFDHDHLASFKQFLGGHADVAQDMSRNPSLAKDQGYVQNHPEFDNYLKANPGVRSDLMQNPDGFVKGAQQFNGSSTTQVGTSGTTGTGTTGTGATTTGSAKGSWSSGTGTTAPTHDPDKPNQ
jgi:hypothetical protein